MNVYDFVKNGRHLAIYEIGKEASIFGLKGWLFTEDLFYMLKKNGYSLVG